MEPLQRPAVDPLAALASEVVRVMNDERLGPDCVPLATSIVMTKSGGFGNATKVQALVEDFLSKNPEVKDHLRHSASGRRPVSRSEAFAAWQNQSEDRAPVLDSLHQPTLAQAS